MTEVYGFEISLIGIDFTSSSLLLKLVPLQRIHCLLELDICSIAPRINLLL